MTPRKFPTTAWLAALLVSLPAAATDWHSDPAGSTLEFTAESQGESFDGRFARFEPRIRFDPDAPQQGRFDVAVALDSVDTGNDERDEMLADPAFFGRASRAHYHADAFTALGGDRFRADGMLQLNGIEHPVALEFTFVVDNGRAVLTGEAVLDRLAFEVGSGDWEDPDMIARDVRVRTRLDLRPARP